MLWYSNFTVSDTIMIRSLRAYWHPHTNFAKSTLWLYTFLHRGEIYRPLKLFCKIQMVNQVLPQLASWNCVSGLSAEKECMDCAILCLLKSAFRMYLTSTVFILYFVENLREEAIYCLFWCLSMSLFYCVTCFVNRWSLYLLSSYTLIMDEIYLLR